MADYTPPSGDDVDFLFSGGYSAPLGDDVDFDFTEDSPSEPEVEVIADASSGFVFDEPGVDEFIVRWTTDLSGDYRLEMGGTGAETGDLMSSGYAIANMEMEVKLSAADIKAASGYSGAGTYRFNLYVKKQDDTWTDYED